MQWASWFQRCGQRIATKRFLRWFLWIFWGGFLVVGGLAIAFLLWDLPDYSIRAEDEYDVMVVLGGGQQARANEAARVWKKYPEMPVIITGDWPFYEGGMGYLLNLLLWKGIESDSITVEPAASSTWENAEYTVPVLRKWEAKKVVLVTDWFHSGRALRCFRHFAPEIQFDVSCKPRPKELSKRERDYLLREKAALIYYWWLFLIH